MDVNWWMFQVFGSVHLSHYSDFMIPSQSVRISHVRLDSHVYCLNQHISRSLVIFSFLLQVNIHILGWKRTSVAADSSIIFFFWVNFPLWLPSDFIFVVESLASFIPRFPCFASASPPFLRNLSVVTSPVLVGCVNPSFPLEVPCFGVTSKLHDVHI